MQRQQKRFSDFLTAPARRAFGSVLAFLDLPGLRDILLHTKDQRVEIWVDQGAGLKRVKNVTLRPPELRQLAINLVSVGGRHIDELNPCTDVQIGAGIRVHAVLEPIVSEAAAISIRVPSLETLSIMDLFRSGLCDTVTARTILEAIKTKQNILITGATASGKTTLLTALLGEISPFERIISIEDVKEIRPIHPHHIALETRQANTEGIGEITLDNLLRESLRMRPDRIVLGECRGKEVVTLLTALNTGHDGGASTLHANSMQDIPSRLEALGALAGLTPEALARQTVSAIDLAVHVSRQAGKHKIDGLGRFVLNSNGLLHLEEFSAR